MESRFDRVVLVDAPATVRLARLQQHRGLDEAEARRMIDSQMPSAEKRRRADYVIDNTGTLEALGERVDEVWAALLREASGGA